MDIKTFAKMFDITESKGALCIQRLLGKQCKFYSHKSYGLCKCHPPEDDHASIWLKDGKPHMYVTQPYSIDDSKIIKMEEFANRHNLEFIIDDSLSWWYPPNSHRSWGTTLVMWTAK